MKKWIIAPILVLNFVTTILCGDYVLIVNKDNPLSSVSSADLKRLYTGKLDNIDNNSAIPVNLSLDNPAAISFLKEVVGMENTDYKSFWLAQQIRGGSSAPVVKKSEADMLSFIKENSNAVGYIPKGTAPDGVKVIDVK
jgi:ABC-type phosphate transport system substrate-binding protein